MCYFTVQLEGDKEKAEKELKAQKEKVLDKEQVLVVTLCNRKWLSLDKLP